MVVKKKDTSTDSLDDGLIIQQTGNTFTLILTGRGTCKYGACILMEVNRSSLLLMITQLVCASLTR